ncbi:MAG TPA: dihydroxyacetone kinase phosphoryl donor subunit DhaM [Actinomycetaceae bacterium]|nr:dihydroxyacetone kinase phosphoryl donor subunit DhaM [Actinomycetaceae bacterium]
MIGIVIVSHSAKLAEGVVELAGQMAPDVKILPAGGTDEGRLGTSLRKISSAIDELLETANGVVLLSDLGSATMTAATAIEFLDDGAPVVLADAPLVEGSVAAAAVAQGGGSLGAVRAAAEFARESSSYAPVPSEGTVGGAPTIVQAAGGAPAPSALGVTEQDHTPERASPPTESTPSVSRTVRLVNELGLHARPAAQLASLAVSQDARVTINGIDATSVIALLSLGLPPGAELTVEASGENAEAALHAVVALVEGGFGEAKTVS